MGKSSKPPREPSRFVLRYTIRELLGVVAGLSVGGWLLRIVCQACMDSARSEGMMTLGPHHFLLRRMQGITELPDRGEVREILDWHERRDQYVLAGVVLAAAGLLGMAHVLRARRAGRTRRAVIVSAVFTALIAGLLTVGVVAWNRAALVRNVGWFAHLVESDRKSIERYSPEGVPARDRWMAARLKRDSEYLARYKALSERPWYRTLLPLPRPPILYFQYVERDPGQRSKP